MQVQEPRGSSSGARGEPPVHRIERTDEVAGRREPPSEEQQRHPGSPADSNSPAPPRS